MVIKDQTIISIQTLSHTYEKWGTTVCALRDISLDFQKGKWIMLVGPNGAGKTTLLQILGGEVSGKTSGRVLLKGEDVLKGNYWDRGKYFASIQQDPMLSTVPELTIAEHFALSSPDEGGWISPVSNTLRHKISNLLQPFQLDERIDLPVGLLSGGERQILALLIARLRKVDVFLLDEPIGALDLQNARTCLSEIKSFVSDGITVLMVTHDLNVACKYGDRLVGLARGRLVLDLNRDEIEKYGPLEIWKILEQESREEI